MNTAQEEALKKGFAPMAGGVALVLAGLYGLAGRDGPGWDTFRGVLVFLGFVAILVPLFMVVVPRLLPPDE